MELASYADFAVRLVNSEEPDRACDRLGSVDEVRDLFAGNLAAHRANPADVPRLRAARPRFRAVFEAAADGREEESVAVLNRLLLDYPVSPQISGHGLLDEHGRPRWHLHLAEQAGSAAALYAAIAAMGLAVFVTEQGMHRLGMCAAPPCRNAYLDTSTNRSRRYCSDRCATRANVAAYRARRRASSAPPAPSPAAGTPVNRGSHEGRGQ